MEDKFPVQNEWLARFQEMAMRPMLLDDPLLVIDSLALTNPMLTSDIMNSSNSSSKMLPFSS